MKVTTKGQVTIPIDIREKLGIFPNTEVEFEIEGNIATLRKATPKNGKRSRGEEIVARLKGSGTANRDLTTDQILALMRG